MTHLFQSAMHVLAESTSTTIPDDFLNLYPDVVPDQVGNLGSTGIAVGPFVLGAVVFLILGAAIMGRRKRTA
jgi:hypothetical protein